MFHVEHYGELVLRELEPHLKALGISLSPDQQEQVALYALELARWNQKMNLTALTTTREVAIKHFLDSLYGARVFSESPQQGRMLDVGSGAGLPGIPLKIVFPDFSVYLLEKIKKKASFLMSLIGKLRLENAFVLDKSLEELTKRQVFHEFFDYITIRAVKTESYYDILTSLLVRGGRILLYRSGPFQEGIGREGLKLSSDISYSLPFDYGMRHLSVLKKC